MWGGAQWVLATLFVFWTISPPIIRAALKCAGAPKIKPAARLFYGEWLGRLMFQRVPLVIILHWGGFW